MAELAAALPDPSILSGFNPLEYLLTGNQSIAEIPDNPDFLLRWWPRLRNGQALNDLETMDDVFYFTDKDILERWRGYADEEYQKLSTLGIRMPEPDIDIIRFISNARAVGLPGVVEYSIVRRFPGSPLQSTDVRGIPLIGKYTKYLETAEKSTLMLVDIFKANQHMAAGDPHLSGEPVLHDTEPMLSFSNKKIAAAIRDLERWATDAQADEAVRRRIGSLAM